MYHIEPHIIPDIYQYDKNVRLAIDELVYMEKDIVNYSIIHIDNILISNIFIETRLLIANRINDIILNKIMKLERISKRYIALGYNPPVYFVCGIDNRIKIVQVGFNNKFNNCIDTAIINDNVDILVLGDCEHHPREIVLPDNIELRINTIKYNNTFIKNIEHIKGLINDYVDSESDVDLRVDKHIIFDRLESRTLGLKCLKSIETIEIKNTTNVEVLKGFVINAVDTLILNEKITKLRNFGFDSDRHNDLVKIITPLKEIYLNGYIATYDEKTDSYKIPNNETVILETCLVLDKERYKELV